MLLLLADVASCRGPNHQDVQFVIIATNCEGEAALDDRMVRRIARVFQGACCQQRIMSRIEGDCAEFFPVPHH